MKYIGFFWVIFLVLFFLGSCGNDKLELAEVPSPPPSSMPNNNDTSIETDDQSEDSSDENNSSDEDGSDDNDGGSDDSAKRVTLCHKPLTRKKTLSVLPKKVQGHLNHGDYLGACL